MGWAGNGSGGFSARSFRQVAGLAGAALLLIASPPAHAGWIANQITNNNADDSALLIGPNGGNLAWKDTTNNILYYYGGGATSTVYSGVSNYFHIDGTTVVYNRWDGSDWEIARWTGGVTTQVTNNAVDDINPKYNSVSDVLAWEQYYGPPMDWEIMYNGSRITSNGFPDSWNQVGGATVAWFALETFGGGAYNYVRMYDGSSIRTLSAAGDTPTTAGLAVSGTRAVWLALYEGTDREVAYYNGTSTARLTNDSVDQYGVAISGANAVWVGQGGTDGGTDYEVFHYDGSTVRQLTADDVSQANVGISGSRIVWAAPGGSDGGADSEIFVYDISTATVTQMTANSRNDANPVISGDTIGWLQHDGTDWEIMRAQVTSQCVWARPAASGPGNWFDSYGSSNWNTVLPPTATDDAFINNGGTARAWSPIIVNSLTLGQNAGDSGTLQLYTGSSLTATSVNVGLAGTGRLELNDAMGVVRNLPGGTVNVGPSGTITGLMDWLFGGTLNMNGGTVSIPGVVWFDAAAPGSTATLSGGQLTCNSLMVGESRQGALVANNGAQVNTGWGYIAYSSGSSGSVTIQDTGSRWAANSLFVGGRGTGAGGAGVLTIQNGGTVRVGSNLQIWSPGTVELAAGGTLSVDTLSNAGTFNWTGGTLEYRSAGGLTVGPGGPLGIFLVIPGGGSLIATNGLRIWSGAELRATGAATVTGTVTNDGQISGPSLAGQWLAFIDGVSGEGDYSGNIEFRAVFSPGASPAAVWFENLLLADSATLEMELAGTAPGAEYDVVRVSGSVTVDGTLAVVLIGGFVPSAGTTFRILEFNPGMLFGTFDTVDLPSLPGGLGWDTTALYSIGQIAVAALNADIPEPATLTLLVLGGLGLVARRRRRP